MAGRDFVPSSLVRDCVEALTAPSLTIFSRVLPSFLFAGSWGRICPVLMSGNVRCFRTYLVAYSGFRSLSLLYQEFRKDQILDPSCICYLVTIFQQGANISFL